MTRVRGPIPNLPEISPREYSVEYVSSKDHTDIFLEGDICIFQFPIFKLVININFGSFLDGLTEKLPKQAPANCFAKGRTIHVWQHIKCREDDELHIWETVNS